SAATVRNRIVRMHHWTALAKITFREQHASYSREMSDPVASIPIPGIFKRRARLSFTGEYPNLTIRSRPRILEFCLVLSLVLLIAALVLIETVKVYSEGTKALTGRDIGNIVVAIPMALFLPFSLRSQTQEFSPTGLRVRSRFPWFQPRFYHWGTLV